VTLGSGKRFSISTAVFLLVALCASARSAAQAPPGPLPGPPPADGSSAARPSRPDLPRVRNLGGTWRLNRDQSDDPRKKMQQGRGSGRPSGGHGPVGGWPGGHGGYGGHQQSPEDREKIELFIAPAGELTIAGQDPEIDIRDDADRKFTAFTDGRKVEKSKDPKVQQFGARWDDYRLVMEGKDPRGNKYERSYEVLEGNQRLRETLLLKVGRNNAEVSIHYLYDLVGRAKS